MFFYLSKILWFFVDPGNAFLLLLLRGHFLEKCLYPSYVWQPSVL